MILFRTDHVSEGMPARLAELAAASGRPVTVLIDERRARAGDLGFGKISLDTEELRRMGLFTPSDFAWCCGDYGFYAARQRFPDVPSFWMIEDDVRIGAPQLFFKLADGRPDIDLLAGWLCPAQADWWWHRHVWSRDAAPHRCFFPVVRLSARAIDALFRKRIEHSRQLRRRALWPNDESFVATTVMATAELTAQDLNALGTDTYDDTTFSFRTLIDGAGFRPGNERPWLYHPVLEGVRYRSKAAKLSAESERKSLSERLRRKFIPPLAGQARW